MARSLLTNEAKLYVVQSLACFVSPTEVAKQVKEHFDIAVKLPTILHYDPTKAQGADLSEELKQLFHDTRQAFKTQLDNIPCANAAYRLSCIQEVIDRARQRNNDAMLLQANKQAQDEMTPKEGKGKGDGETGIFAIYRVPVKETIDEWKKAAQELQQAQQEAQKSAPSANQSPSEKSATA